MKGVIIVCISSKKETSAGKQINLSISIQENFSIKLLIWYQIS